MSVRCSAETVPFKINVWKGEWLSLDDNDRVDTGFKSLNGYLSFLNSKDEGEYFEYAGWQEKDGDYGKIIAEFFEKQGDKVFYVNEHKDAVVGGEDSCFFSARRESLERFCEEWGFDKSKIEVNKPVMQNL